MENNPVLLQHNNFSSTLMSLNGDIVYKSNEKQVYPSASLIKLPIMLYIFDQRLHDLETIIPIDEKVEGAGVSPYLSQTEYTVHDLVTLMIIVSDNRATNTLIEWIGMDTLNAYFLRNNLGDTKLQRKMMDTERRALGYDNFTSAHDIFQTLSLIKSHEQFKAMFQIMKQQLLKDKTLMYLTDETIEFGTKTGDFDNVHHDAGIVRFQDNEIIFVVLTDYDDAQFIHQAFHDLGLYFQSLIKS
ncbi:serine hydrolase [Macrococcus epidermidis]|uniref:Serine hydrolase n=1 Tax=Macrococcus epidermidis TaxID=1902580 RepID=A0A327ZNM1_9STAP|nr:serine hydrolase [Macrococcus epidermidis]RAK43957.1 serine hydrolase [Macrococcus epidermidis]